MSQQLRRAHLLWAMPLLLVAGRSEATAQAVARETSGAAALESSKAVARAQAAAADLGLTYFQCKDPDTRPPCVAPSEKAKPTSCKACKAWVERSVGSEVGAKAASEALANNSYEAMNRFAHDVSAAGYKTPFPTTEYGQPVTVGTLFEHASQLGWIQLPAGSPKTGSIAVWRTGAALVLSDSAGIKVLYPSSRKDGALTVGDLPFLIGGSQVKFLVPAPSIREAKTATLHDDRY